MALYITGVNSDGTYFIDQNGNPRMFVGEDCWFMLINAGRWGGTYQTDIDGYMAARAAQGYTAVETCAYSNDDGSHTMVYGDSRDWDGTWPFNSTTDPSSGLNETFWVRRDYLFASGAAHGITPVLSMCSLVGTSALLNPCWGWTNQQWSDYGTALANRYKTVPNVLWIYGDEVNTANDTGVGVMLTALRAAGDTHLFSIQNGYPTTSRQSVPDGGIPNSYIGPSWAQYNWCYDYCQSYNTVIPAHQESTGTGFTGTIPCIWADGYYLDTGTTGGITNRHLERLNWWWALSSGACGCTTGDGNVFQWNAASLAYISNTSNPTVGNFYVSQVPAIVNAFSSLTNWQHLYPDVTSALVTSGRNTFATAGNYYYTDNSDTYVTAAKTPDGSLAVIYMSHPGTITINQSQMAAGYGAYWLDPANGAKTTVTAGTTYNSTTQGTNSEGDSDWVLVLASPPYATWQVP